MNVLQLFYTTLSPVFLFGIMVGMGLSLTLADIKRVVIFPKAAAIGLTGQLLLLPAMAFLLVETLQPMAVIAVGIIILAACPGGITSNTYVFASRGDVALSVTLTAISSIVTVFTIPLLTSTAMQFYLDTEVMPDLPVLNMMGRLALMTILPITTGMLIRHFRPAFALRWIEFVRKLALIFLIVLIGGSIILSLSSVWDYFMDAALVAGCLNIFTMALGFAIASYFRLPKTQIVSITYEVGVQNLALALTVAIALLQQPVMGLTALIYGIFAKITALSFIAYARKMARDQEIRDMAIEIIDG